MKSIKGPQRGDRVRLLIDRLSVGGRGVARHEGLVIFVDFVAPLDEIEAEISLIKKNYAEGRLLKIIKPSPHRVVPPCPVYGQCGGCNWQHLSYSEQLKQKRALVEESLRKFSGYTLTPDLVTDVLPSPQQLHYRNRIQFHHAPGKVGFFKRASHELIDIESCAITEMSLNAEIPRLKREFQNLPPGRIEIALGITGTVIDHSDEQSVGFSQVNSAQNHLLISFVIEQATQAVFSPITNPSAHLLYDLYAGSGNFTFPLAAALPQVAISAAELDPLAVERARRQVLDGQKIEFTCLDVEKFLKLKLQSMTDLKKHPTLIVLDPPRTGCGPEVMRLLVELRPANIFYISCHPVTLARDLKTLAEARYRLNRVQPFDMFPQTDHVECFVHLQL